MKSTFIVFRQKEKFKSYFHLKKSLNFLLQIGKKVLQSQLFFLENYYLIFFFQINLQNFCFVMMTKKEAFAGGIRSSQSTAFKNLENVEKKILCTKQNLALSTNIENITGK